MYKVTHYLMQMECDMNKQADHFRSLQIQKACKAAYQKDPKFPKRLFPLNS